MSKVHGISLLEVLITLAIVSIAASFVLPNLERSLLQNQRIALTNRFISSILFARLTALTDAREIIVCPSLDGQVCGQADHWVRGWIIVQPGGHNEEATVLRYEPNDLTIQMVSNRAQFVLRPPGRRSTNGTVRFCSRLDHSGRAVIVSYTGRPRVSNIMPDGALVDCVNPT